MSTFIILKEILPKSLEGTESSGLLVKTIRAMIRIARAASVIMDLVLT